MQRHCDLLREIQRVLCGWSRTVVSGGDRCREVTQCIQVHGGHLQAALCLVTQSCTALCDPMDCSHVPKDTQLQDGDDALSSIALLPAE